jgi:hypothetical protein
MTYPSLWYKSLPLDLSNSNLFQFPLSFSSSLNHELRELVDPSEAPARLVVHSITKLNLRHGVAVVGCASYFSSWASNMLIKFSMKRLVKPEAPDPRSVSGSLGAISGDEEEVFEGP